ncbi:hypothetical protein [Actinoallomurus iriomotensis]|uniref:Uncharacterized protein n=1 Tax=Actinoallomurus iriomotensis TaxID=478107 RepID=A0A9W6VXS2_9ACTN|nr:hypothetical protein [Actinoallomurus iriomotensis]GLY84170.1 hypothetical protein Airi02_020990 [Actinoallomurus iriomotensis]
MAAGDRLTHPRTPAGARLARRRPRRADATEKTGVIMNASRGGWNDPELDALAEGLRIAHARVANLSPLVRPQMTRHLLVITDLAKRDAALALRRLESFLSDLDGDENVP